MPRAFRASAVALGFSAALAAGPAIASPQVMPGWPVGAPAGTVHAGPGGGVTVIAETIEGIEDPVTGAFAFTRAGRRLWQRLVGCNLGPECQQPAVAPGLQRDGSYGPVVFDKGPVSVGPAGQLIDPGCGGALLGNGTCVSAGLPTANGVTVRATRAGATVWTFDEPALATTTPASVDLPPVMADGAGGLYVGFRDTAADGKGRVLAIDPATGAVQWRRDGADALSGLARGVLALTPTSLTAFGPDGAVVWSKAKGDLRLAPGHVDATALAATFDPASGHVYLAPHNERGAIIALDAASGLELWRTVAVHAAAGVLNAPGPLVSIGPTGTLYLASVHGGNGLVARGPDGRKRWSYRTATPVTGARELADGTVALTVRPPQQNPGTMQGLLIRIDPRKAAPVVTRTRVTLDRRTVQMNCADLAQCLAETGDGAVLRVDAPRATPMRVRVRSASGGLPDGRNPPGFRTTITWTAPGGTTFMRVLDLGNSGGETIDPGGTGNGIVRPGRYILEVSWREAAATQVRRIAVTVVVTRRGPALPGLG